MTKISNQYSLTNILTADLANSRLGINNVSPTVALDVTGAGKFSGVLTLGSTISNGTLTYTLPSATGTLALTSALSGTTNYVSKFTSSTGIGNSLIYDNGTSVGIGTTTAGLNLSVQGLYGLPNTSGTQTVGIFRVQDSASNIALDMGVIQNAGTWIQSGNKANTEVLPLALNPNGGNIGIGTIAPQTLLTIAGTNQALGGAFNTYGNLLIYSTDSYAQNKGGSISLGGKYNSAGTPIATFARIHGKKESASDGATSGYLSFEITNDATALLTERMRITSAGNVGIGTSSPQSRLQAVLSNGVTFTPTSTGSIGGSVAQRVHVQAIEPGFMLSTDSNAGNTGQTGSQTYSFGLQLATYGAGDWRSQIYFGSTPLSFVYSGDQGANASERMRISTNGSIGAPNGTNIYNASDVRLKKNVSTTTYGLDTISALNPVKFNWVDGFELTEDGKDLLGFIAQEVQTVIPEAVESFGGNSITIGDTTIDNPLRVNEKFLVPVLVKAIQELSAKVSLLENK